MDSAIRLLQKLISTPSLSHNESQTADIINEFLKNAGVVETTRYMNNIVAFNKHFDSSKPTILLNSHHDTVRPNAGYTRDPFVPSIEDGKIYGLGSNDAGGSLVSLIHTFLYFYDREDLLYNLCLATTAEEECSGPHGIEEVILHITPIEFAVIGEPTQMKMAVAGRGLMVLDCVSHGKAGHAAREEGVNAIYEALPDIEWFRTYKFPKVSPMLGHVKMNVTVIQAGELHNVVPAECKFAVDVRLTEEYTHKEILQTISEHVKCEVKPRSTRICSSRISLDHPIVRIGEEMGIEKYGSPTTSDASLISTIPCLKMGPGNSSRSHMADEFIYINEIEQGIHQYIEMLSKLILK